MKRTKRLRLINFSVITKNVRRLNRRRERKKRKNSARWLMISRINSSKTRERFTKRLKRSMP